MSQKIYQTVRLDLNNPVFQRRLFNLTKSDQRNILNTLRKLANMTWQQVYSDYGLKWEVILSQKGPSGKKLYSFRIGKGFRGVAYRDGLWLRLLSLHPDHDSAYQWAIFSTKADFVTWAKYIKKNELKDLEYTSCLMFNGKRYLIA